MKTNLIAQVHVEPELRADLESVLRYGESMTDFVEESVRNAVAFRRIQGASDSQARAASDEYHRTYASMPIEAALVKLQSKLDAKRNKLDL